MSIPDELISHLERQTGLSRARVEGLVSEVLAYFSDTPEEFVRRRHAVLQMTGLKNPAIFEVIHAELAALRFRAPSLSDRQLRRMIYG
ncbi:MAG: hypothetical protein AAF493_27155 [Pseudomonadota bacterium]